MMNLQHLFNEPIISTEPIEKGFSRDQKIIVNNKYLVRVIPLTRITQFEYVFDVQQKFFKVALCQQPIALKKDDQYGYYITEYIPGKNGLEVIESFTSEEQYHFGVQAAKELVTFHNAYPIDDFDVKHYLDDYLNRKIKTAEEHNIVKLLPELPQIIQVVKDNIHHLYQLKGVQTHADYHLFNMIFDRGVYKGVIDFERCRPGILLNDFRNNTPHNSTVSPYFASGFIDGYLDRIPVKQFFLLYNVYDLLLTIASIPWVMEYDNKNIEKSVQLVKDIFKQKDYLKASPSWYEGKYK